MADCNAEVEALAALSPADLRTRWTAVTGRPPPKVSPKLLRLALAHTLQVKTHGGLSRAARQRLAQVAAGKSETRSAPAGTRLLREWQGTAHVVTIDETGAIHWNEWTWGSLSAVARAITGTRWSGPAFFGLKRKVRS